MTALNSEIEWRLKWLWFACGMLLLLGVAIGSLIPVSVQGGNDKVAHVVIYALLSGWFSLLAGRSELLWRVLPGLIAYGALIEVLQGLTDYRSAEFGDVIANSLGASLGLLVYFTSLRELLAKLDNRLFRLFQ